MRDLGVGAPFTMDDRGEQALKGIAEPWRLFAVSREPLTVPGAAAGPTRRKYEQLHNSCLLISPRPVSFGQQRLQRSWLGWAASGVNRGSSAGAGLLHVFLVRLNSSNLTPLQRIL